jgi:hypothetical protein
VRLKPREARLTNPSPAPGRNLQNDDIRINFTRIGDGARHVEFDIRRQVSFVEDDDFVGANAPSSPLSLRRLRRSRAQQLLCDWQNLLMSCHFGGSIRWSATYIPPDHHFLRSFWCPWSSRSGVRCSDRPAPSDKRSAGALSFGAGLWVRSLRPGTAPPLPTSAEPPARDRKSSEPIDFIRRARQRVSTQTRTQANGHGVPPALGPFHVKVMGFPTTSR